MNRILKKMQGGLIVSCQAEEGTPFLGKMGLMAKAAEMSGAICIRSNGPKDIRQIKKAVKLPVIGINKKRMKGYEVFITPDFASAKAVVDAGAEIVALETTLRTRKEPIEEVIEKVRKYSPKTLLMADISTYKEGIFAHSLGFDLIGTTLSGYTSYSRQASTPDFGLLRKLSKKIDTPLIAEGKIWTPAEAKKALDSGAFAVVVGTAITRPHLIVEKFAKALKA